MIFFRKGKNRTRSPKTAKNHGKKGKNLTKTRRTEVEKREKIRNGKIHF